MERHELIEKLTEIQNANYNSFKGTNEAILHSSEDIADLIAKIKVGHQIKQEALKAQFRGFLLEIIVDCKVDDKAFFKLHGKIKELEN